MKKEELRKVFFKLKFKGHSYNQCRRILLAEQGYEVTIRTLQRWMNRLDNEDWDLRDNSRKPHIIHMKVTSEIEKKVIDVRNKTGWGQDKISTIVNDISPRSINKLLNKNKLINSQTKRKKRIKYIRFQRKHPNSLWQIDHSDQKIKDKWLISVIDDCSRYSIGLFAVNEVTTNVVIQIIDNLIKIHGKPKQILTDNGSAYGLKSKHSKFDIKCRKRGIHHIRSGVHSPTTCGKVERLFQTIKQELPYCKDINEFRMRYNHFRKHTSLDNKTPAEIYFSYTKLLWG